MLDPAQLAALAAVLATGSFDRAAARLGVTPSAISQRIRALEERIGTALIIRAQPARATPAGARLARHADDLRLLEQALAADLGLAPGTAPRLRIAVNADSLATWFLPALAALPEMLFDLEVDDQDHSADWLRRGEVVAAVTSGGADVPGTDRIALGRLRYIATASPAFARRWFAHGVTAAALIRAPALEFNRKDRLQRDWAAAVSGAPVTLPCHRIASSTAFVEAAELGLGWGLNPEPLARDGLASGRLVALMPDRPLDVPLDWQVARLPGAALAPLTRAVRAAARAALLAA
jgi:LysR family transcriptional regulator (chromosome initiation inhibitor)